MQAGGLFYGVRFFIAVKVPAVLPLLCRGKRKGEGKDDYCIETAGSR
ncbi:MAG: hypothetical protein ACFWT7_08360 [Succiniclasticum sp.]|jgi:hypothetical protein